MLSFRPSSTRLALIGLVAILLFAGVAARAAGTHPDALDRSVDHLSAGMLRHAPTSRLLDDVRQDAAERLTAWIIPGRIALYLVASLWLAWFWRSGRAAAWRQFLRRRFGRESLARFAFGMSLGLIVRLGTLPVTFYLYRIDRMMQIASQIGFTWLRSWGMTTLLWMIAGGVVAIGALWLVERSHQWYIPVACGIAAVILGSVAIDPLFIANAIPTHRFTMNDIPVVLVTQPVGENHTVLLGLGPTRRLVVDRGLLQEATRGELRFRIARRMAQAQAHLPLRRALILALIVVLVAACGVALADRIGFRKDDDSLSRLALVGAMLALFALPAQLILDGMHRSDVLTTDRAALHLVASRAEAVRTAVRDADRRLEVRCPTPIEQLFDGAQPGVAQRIARLRGSANDCR